eukprot:scaffold269800_cov15-Tisochrysis_lutea.AAC.1
MPSQGHVVDNKQQLQAFCKAAKHALVHSLFPFASGEGPRHLHALPLPKGSGFSFLTLELACATLMYRKCARAVKAHVGMRAHLPLLKGLATKETTKDEQ